MFKKFCHTLTTTSIKEGQKSVEGSTMGM